MSDNEWRGKAPGFWFYTGDWLKDPELRFCSIFARGLLLDLLCYMFEAKEQGYLVWPDGTPRSNEDIANAISGGDLREKLLAIEELERKGVVSRDSRGVLYSRRITRLASLSAKRKQSGSKGGSKTQAKRQANEQQNSEVSDSVSDSDSDSVSDEMILNTCSEPLRSSEPAEPLDVRFSCPVTGGAKVWSPSIAFVQRMVAVYDTIDAEREIQKAIAWIESNPAKRKTPRGMPSFLNRWLSSAADNPKTPKRSNGSVDDWGSLIGGTKQ